MCQMLHFGGENHIHQYKIGNSWVNANARVKVQELGRKRNQMKVNIESQDKSHSDMLIVMLLSKMLRVIIPLDSVLVKCQL